VPSRNDYVDLLMGFQDLAVAAVNQGGRGLDTARFGPDLSRGNRRLLEHVRRVLVLAQEPSPDSRQAARAEWPGLERRLQRAIATARTLGIPDQQLSAVLDNVALVGERYVRVRRRGPTQVETPEGYADLFNGVLRLLDVLHQASTDKRDAVVPLNIGDINKAQRAALQAVRFGPRLTARHRAMLERMRSAFILARTEEPGSAARARREWLAIQAPLTHAFRRAPTFGIDEAGPIEADLRQIGTGLIEGGVYAEAHRKALDESGLTAPNLAFAVERFKMAADEMAEAHKLAEKAFQMTGEKVVDRVFKLDDLAGPIAELLKTPGEVAEKLEEFKKRGVVGKSVTVLDLANKTLSFRNALLKVSFEATRRFAERQVQLAIRVFDQAALARWGAIKNWASEGLQTLERVGKVAAIISVVVSAIKVIDFIAQGKWAEALQEAGETVAGLAATAAGGLAGAGMVGGIAIILAAEAEGIHGAAAMIRYCREESVREAAGRFVGTCVDAANIEARALVADVKLLENPSDADQRRLIEERIMSHVPYWMRHVEDLSSQLADDRVIRLGGQPGLQKALGPEARAILADPARWATANWQQMAEQIRVIFAGANQMAKHVVDTYPRRTSA
jgi:hypothetical protein